MEPGGAVTRQPAMTDVAAAAGVSHQTVSRVLNASPHVAPDTRERVLRAIAALGYRRNQAARALVTGRTETVGVLAQSTALYGPSSTIAALGLAATEAGLGLSVQYVAGFEADTLRDALARLSDQLVAGIVVVAPVVTATAALTGLDVGVPVVTVDGPARPGNVAVDQRAGARMATEHLLAAGHATVHHVAGPQQWHDAVARQAGWHEALVTAGRHVPPVLRADWSAASGFEAGRTVAADPACTAVFAASDALALGVVRALAHAGRRVPDDVSVVGFDDVPEAAFFTPPLTTVRQEFAELGRAALHQLMDRIGDGAPRDGEGPVLVAPRLVARDSVAAPPP